MIRKSYFVKDILSPHLHDHPFLIAFDERALTGQSQYQILTMMNRILPSHISPLYPLINLPSSGWKHRHTREVMPSNRLMGSIDGMS